MSRITGPRDSVRDRPKVFTIDPPFVESIAFGEWVAVAAGAQFNVTSERLAQLEADPDFPEFYAWDWWPTGPNGPAMIHVFPLDKRLRDDERRASLSLFGTAQPVLVAGAKLKPVLDRFIDVMSLADPGVKARSIIITIIASDMSMITMATGTDAAVATAVLNCGAFVLSGVGVALAWPAAPVLAVMTGYGVLNSGYQCGRSIQAVRDRAAAERQRMDDARRAREGGGGGGGGGGGRSDVGDHYGIRGGGRSSDTGGSEMICRQGRDGSVSCEVVVH